MENEGEKTVRGEEEGGKRITQRRIEREREREIAGKEAFKATDRYSHT